MRRQSWLKLGGGVFCAAAVALVVGFGPVVRARAADQAAKRGVSIQIGAVRPGIRRVWLRDVSLRVPEMPALEVRLDSVEVQVDSALSVRSVRGHGGLVRVHGSVEEIREQVARFRERSPSGGPGKSATAYSVDGLALDWEGASGDAERQLVWGARYTREGDVEELSADLLRAATDGVHLEVQGGRATLGRRDGRRVVERLSTDAVNVALDLSSPSLERALPSADVQKPKPEAEVDAGVPPVGREARGRTKTAGGKAAGVGEEAQRDSRPAERWDTAKVIDPERGPRLRRALARLAAITSDALPEDSELDIGGLRARLLRGAEALNVGPARLRVVRARDRVSVSLMPAPNADDPGKSHDAHPAGANALRVALEVPIAEGPVTASIEGGPVSLAALGVQEGDFGLLGVDKASLEARGTATLSPEGHELAVVLNGKLAQLSANLKWLAPSPVRGLALGLRGRVAVWLDGSRLRVDQGELEVGKVRVELKGELEQTKDYKKVWLEGGAPLASCQSMLDASPEGLMPLLAGMQLSGTFALTGKLEVDTRALDKMVTKWSSVNECRITAAPADVSPSRFSRSWTREVLDVTGRPMQTQTGPGTLGWAPKASISKHMDTAVMICEDGAFFRHHGFDQEAIQNSIRENVKAGRFVRGASTISMQLAKNLYLSREKTMSRKLQEAVLTHLLEQELTKDQILELYLNVIEFAPGIYGIGPAAAYYFNSTPSQLSLGQSLYLASILPNPKRQYFGADGAVTPGWSDYLRKLMRIAAKIHRITDSELEEALGEQVTFKKPSSPRVGGDGAGDGIDAAGPPLESEQQQVD